MYDNYLNKQWLVDQINPVIDNYSLHSHFYNLLYLMCVNRFIWKNLPNNIDPDFIEKELANNGELAFINHKTYGYIVTFCVGDYFNIYGRPSKYLCFTPNNEVNEYYDYDSPDLVIIRNNKLSQSSHDFIRRYTNILTEIQKTQEVNLNAQKTPVLITTTESGKLTLENIYEQYKGNKPVIYVNKNIDMNDSVKVFKTDAPYLLDKLQEYKQDQFNECLTFLGINTTPEKKERLITDEVNANNDMTNICLSMFLNTRKQALEEINKKFNLNIELDLAEFCKDIQNKEIKGVGENE